MLVHQWAESYRDYPERYEAACFLVKDAVFVEAGDESAYPKSGDDFHSANPPFERTALQYASVSPKTGESRPVIIFVMRAEQENDRFLAAITYRVGGRWITLPTFVVERIDDGRLAVFRSNIRDVFEQEEKGREMLLAQGLVGAAWRIFAVMACSNVRTRDHKPDAALNKKRAKAGKVPLVSYKTLEIVVPNTRYEGGGSGGGTHASPRVHLRRGHIRKIADGRTVWVQACVVGSKHGMVLKDYKLRSAA